MTPATELPPRPERYTLWSPDLGTANRLTWARGFDPDIDCKLAAIRSVIDGSVTAVLAPGQDTWREVFAGNVSFVFGEISMTFFNDCDSLDYTEQGDGIPLEADPLDMLTTDERRSFEFRLREARSA